MKKPPHRDGLNEKNIVYRFTIRSIATRNGTHSHAGRTHRHRMNRESDAHTPYSGYRWCSHNGLASYLTSQLPSYGHTIEVFISDFAKSILGK